jgi:hypothetical protein
VAAGDDAWAVGAGLPLVGGAAVAGARVVAEGPVAATGGDGLAGRDGKAGDVPAGSATDGAGDVPTGAGPDVGGSFAFEVALDDSPSPCEAAIFGRVARWGCVGASPWITESGSDDKPIR